MIENSTINPPTATTLVTAFFIASFRVFPSFESVTTSNSILLLGDEFSLLFFNKKPTNKAEM